MQFGLTIFPTPDAIDPMTLGRAAEQRGFESLFFPEHTHIPTSRRPPYPGGGELPRRYAHTYDPLVALTSVADELQRRAADAGRDLIPMTLFGAEPDPGTIERYAAAGITRCLFMLPAAGPETVLPALNRYAELAR